jgi:hypothetical protein
MPPTTQGAAARRCRKHAHGGPAGRYRHAPPPWFNSTHSLAPWISVMRTSDACSCHRPSTVTRAVRTVVAGAGSASMGQFSSPLSGMGTLARSGTTMLESLLPTTFNGSARGVGCTAAADATGGHGGGKGEGEGEGERAGCSPTAPDTLQGDTSMRHRGTLDPGAHAVYVRRRAHSPTAASLNASLDGGRHRWGGRRLRRGGPAQTTKAE